MMYNSHTRGGSVYRALMFEFPQDTNTHDIDTQFMWGAAIVVTPVVTQVR